MPNFNSDEEISAFMETHDAFQLVDERLAEIVPTPSFFRSRKSKAPILKDKHIQIAFKDERSLRKVLSSLSSTRTFLVLDVDLSGILLRLPDSPQSESFYIPYLNIGGIRVLTS